MRVDFFYLPIRYWSLWLQKNNVRSSNENAMLHRFFKEHGLIVNIVIHNNATHVKMQWYMKQFYSVLHLVTCVRVKITPLIKRLKRSYQEHSGIKDYFLISFSIQAFYIH